MATSGSIDFSMTRDDIITEALEILGVLAEGEAASANQLTSCARTLNMIVKNLQARGLNLNAVQRTYLFLETNKGEYALSSSGDHFTTSFGSTTLSAAAANASTTITVADATGISNGDYIGIYVSDGTMHWTTVSGAPSGSTVTLAAALDASATSGSAVYYYTTKANRPMLITEGYLKQYGGSEIPLDQLSRKKYASLTNKTTDGTVLEFYYNRLVASPTLFVWPEESDPRNYLTLYVQRTLEDFDSGTNDADYPQEWLLPLTYQLVVYLAPKYGVPRTRQQEFRAMAVYLLDEAEGFDIELGTSIEFGVDTDGN